MKHFILTHIVATSSNNVIGLYNKLPWSIPEDLEFFKKKTAGHTLIMGRKTFESLKNPLSGRINIVISKNKNLKPKGVFVFHNIHQAIEEAKKKSAHKEIFIIGGGQIYKQSMNLIEKIYLTRIHQSYKGNAFYPDIPGDQFKLVHKLDQKGPPPFSFLTYQKRDS